MSDIVVYIPSTMRTAEARVWIHGAEISHLVSRVAIVADTSEGIAAAELRLVGDIMVIDDLGKAP